MPVRSESETEGGVGEGGWGAEVERNGEGDMDGGEYECEAGEGEIGMGDVGGGEGECDIGRSEISECDIERGGTQLFIHSFIHSLTHSFLQSLIRQHRPDASP